MPSFTATCAPGQRWTFCSFSAHNCPIIIEDVDRDGSVTISSRVVAVELLLHPGPFIFEGQAVVDAGLISAGELASIQAGVWPPA